MTERVEGIAGSMYSGKTDELIRIIGREEIARKKVQVFKPAVDTRWGKVNKIMSHSGAEHDATPVEKAVDIVKLLQNDTQVVAIDEAQFLDRQIVDVVRYLSEKDVKVILAGLPLDFRGKPFGKMPELLAMSDSITRLTAICDYLENGDICGREATRTQRLTLDRKPADYGGKLVVIGEKDSYAARCPDHHFVPGKPKPRIK